MTKYRRLKKGRIEIIEIPMRNNCAIADVLLDDIKVGRIFYQKQCRKWYGLRDVYEFFETRYGFDFRNIDQVSSVSELANNLSNAVDSLLND